MLVSHSVMYETSYHHQPLSEYSFLVTGAAGFIGSHLVEYLLKYGARKVRGLDNLLTGNKNNLASFLHHSSFEFVEGSITDFSTCIESCRGIDFVLHQAALGSVPRSVANPADTHLHNVDGFLNMLIAARDTGVKKFVYASSSSVYGDDPTLPKKEEKVGNPLSPYAVSKYTNELYARVFYTTYGLPCIGLRYFNIFGPRQDPKGQYAAVIPLFTDGILNSKEVFINGSGEQTRDFTFVENAVQANIKAIFSGSEANGEVFNIACGENFSVNFLFKSIKELLNSKVEPIYRAPRKGDIQNSLADISKAKRILGYTPSFNFHEGLKITVEYFKNVYAAAHS
ncbi:MAG: SDR family oxidoreductase [Chitinophagales bacterium]|nr:SDR family oxidoreductase [Chitinophagales bacterium]MDW8273411.1 SDR family oxidoreductase [Chitinophagales bacterium]